MYKKYFLSAFSYLFSHFSAAVLNLVCFLKVVILFHALSLKYSFLYRAVLILYGLVWILHSLYNLCLLLSIFYGLEKLFFYTVEGVLGFCTFNRENSQAYTTVKSICSSMQLPLLTR